MKNLIILLLALLFAVPEGWAQRVGAKVGVGYNTRQKQTQKTQPPVEQAYYISYSTGSDANDGLSPARPKKTFGFEINSANPIKKVYFKRGDTWPEFSKNLTSAYNSGNRVTIGAYGTGDKPRLLGSRTITGWTKRSTTNVYVTKVNASAYVNQLFCNGVRMMEARYPNTGYDYIEMVNSTNSFTSNELSATVNYAGAKWIGRTNPYAMPTVTVSSSSSKTITLAEAPFGDLTTNTEGFFLVGKFEFLDSPGEWFYNTTTDSLYFWAPGSVDPDELSVRVSTKNNAFYLSAGSGYITIQDLEMSEYKSSAIESVTGSQQNITITRNTFKNNEQRAIYLFGVASTGHYIADNIIRNSNHLGIELFSTNSTVEGNTIDSIAMFNHLGSSGIGYWYMGSAIYTEGSGNLIQYNTVKNVGYNGIHFYYPSTVQYNYVQNCNLLKDDGGGIYTSSPDVYPAAAQNNGSVIRYNIIDGSWGTAQGFTTYGYTLGEGIYLDESSGGISVYGNSVGNVTSGAYYAHKGYSHLIRDNISYRARYGLLLKHKGNNIIARKNKLYGFSRDYNDKQSEQMVWKFGTTTRPAIDSNTYVQHYKSADIFADSITNYSFAAWKTATGKDAASTVDNTALAANYAERWVYNASKVPKTFYLNNASNVTDAFSDAAVSGSFVLQPYTSKVLEGLNLDCIDTILDATAPVITAFSVPASGTLTISITAFTVTGSPTKYLVNESSSIPALTDAGWTSTVPVSYTFSTAGTKTLYAWARDAAGNISTAATASTTVSVNLKQGLIALYGFEEAGTTLVDSHTNSLNGTNYNNSDAVYSATPVAGKPGNAYSYISTGFKYSRVIDHVLLDFSGAFSIKAAVNVTSFTATRGILSKRDATYAEFELWINTDGSVRFVVAENGNYANRVTIYTAASVIALNTDYLVEVKSNGTDRKAGFEIWVNRVKQSVSYSYAGTLAGTQELSTGIVHTTAPLTVAGLPVLAANMYGKISQIGLWNYATPDAVSDEIYNSGNFKVYSTW